MSGRETVDLDTNRGDASGEVGSEGAAPDNVEIDADPHHGTGSEVRETGRPTDTRVRRVARDETGRGRRSP